MGEKKRHNQSSNKPLGGVSGSSESGDSRDPSVTPPVSKNTCPHLNKAVDQASVRKNFKICGQQGHFTCVECKKNVSGAQSLKCEDPWICLCCGSCCCGNEEKNHIYSHYETPRSDLHVLFLNLRDWTILCYRCKFEVPVDCNKKIGTLVKTLKQQYDKHLRAIPNGVSEIITTDKKGESPESKFLTTNSSDSCKKKNVVVPSTLSKVRGLTNLGNTCFFNSVLQCLAQTHGLVELLREMEVPGETFMMPIKENELICAELDKGVGSISETLASTLTQVSGSNRTDSGGDRDNSNFVVNPRQLLSALRKKCQQFEGTDQHDAHELLRHLLDSVRMEDLRRYHRAILNHVGLSSKESPQEMDENKKMQAKALNQQVCESVLIRPDHIFKGTLVSRLECQTCRHSSERVDSFLDLSLPVTPEKPQPPSVVRRKNHNNNGTDEDVDTYWKSKQEVSHGKSGQKRKGRKKQLSHNTNDNQGEPTITEEDKKDEDSDLGLKAKQEFALMEKPKMTGVQKKSRRRRNQSYTMNETQVESFNEEDKKGLVSVAEPSDADVEDNEDGGCDEQGHRLEVLESGYSSEKQASPRTSPLTHSPGEDSDTFLTRPQSQKRSESGLGSSTVSIQELTVTIPDSPQLNVDLASPNSTQANASPGSQEVSSDSLQNEKLNGCENRNDDILIRRFNSCNPYLPSGDGCFNSNSVVYGWECNPFSDPKNDSDPENVKCLSHNSNDSSSISIPNTPPGRDSSISQSSQDINVKCSPKEISESQHQNSPLSSWKGIEMTYDFVLDESSQPEGRPVSRLEFHGSVARSSPVDLVDSSGIDSAFLNLQLEYYKTEKAEENITDEIPPMYSLLEQSDDELTKMNQFCSILKNDCEMGFTLVGGIVENNPELPDTKTQPSEVSQPAEEVAIQNGPSTLAPRYKFEEGECSLQSCLYQFTAIELMTGNNKVGCESCTARQAKVSGNKESKTVYTAYTKQLLINSVPPIMIFHFKRFEVQMYSIRKISRHVKFPLILDIAPFCSVKCKSVAPGQTQILYSLYGVVEHSGTLRGGHYVAYVKVRSKKDAYQTESSEPNPGKWYHISDSRVNEVNENRVLNSEAYLLFYERLI